jgi:hypothetical protein
VTDQSRRRWLRAGLIVLAITPGVLAAWILAAPRSFYDDFPGGGREWVSALPPYNEHLLRDYGAGELGFFLLLAGAAVLLERRLVQVALLAYAASTLPHLIYHATSTEALSTTDNVLSLGGQAVTVLLPLGLLVLTTERRRHGAHAGPERGSRRPDHEAELPAG